MRAWMKLAVTMAVMLLPGAAGAQEAGQTYAEAVYQESVTGDLGQAIMLYKQAVDTSRDPSLVARATLRIGNCYDKLGQTGLARQAYRRVVENFASQTDAVRLAKLALLTLGPGEHELKEWSDRLKAEVIHLKTALDAVNSGIAEVKARISGEGGKPSEEALRTFEQMIQREETRSKVKRFLASHYFRTAVGAYQALDYERALEELHIAYSLRPDDELIRGYLEKTEFILGRRPKLTPAAMNRAPDDPSAMLLKELEEMYKLAAAAREDGDYRMALAAVEELLDRVRWTDDKLVTNDVKKVLEKAEILAQECLIRLYPAQSRQLKMLSKERRELSEKLKRKLGEVLSSPTEVRQSTPAVLERARELVSAGRLPEAKELLERHLAGAGETPEVRVLLDEIDRAVRREQEEGEKDARFSVQAAAIVLPAKETNILKIPFKALKPAEGEGVPFAWAVVDEKKGREILSVAALVAREALGKFPDMNVAPGERGSGFLGSSMTYVCGYRRRPGAGNNGYEPVNDIVFQGIKLFVTPEAKAGKLALKVEATVSVIVGEPRVVQTEGGQIEIPRVYQVVLKHTFKCEAGQYIVVGSFPNTLVAGTAKDTKQKEDMYLLLSAKKAAPAPKTGGK